MNDFIFQNTTKIIFGKNAEDYIGSEASIYGKTMLVFGGGSVRKNGVYDKVIRSMNESSVDYCELWGVMPNPRIDKVYEGIELARKENVSLILAVGGGSVIDTAKAIAAGVLYDGDAWDFYSGKRTPEIALPVGSVLTIPAAGSESSMSSVITNMNETEKRGCTAACFLPRFAIMNPENTFSLPPYQIACGASDMMAHMMERYFVNTACCDLTDRMIEGAIQTVLEFTPLALKNPQDYDIRAELMWTGCMAHNTILDTGRGGDWASHQIEHQLSAYYDIAHGAGLAIVFPAWMKFVRRTNPKKLVQFGQRVFKITDMNDDDTITLMIERLEEFYKAIGLPVRLSDAEIGSENFAAMAEKAVEAKKNKLGSYVRLSNDDVAEIYRLAL